MGIAIRLALIALVIIGGAIFRDRLSSNAGELKVGDCFDEPVGTQTVKDVQHHPCTEAHTGEVFFVADMPYGKEAPFPGDPAIEDFVTAKCGPAFARYVGGEAQTASLDAGYFYPLAEGWKEGDRNVSCYVRMLNGSALTRSLKVASN